MGLSLTAPIHEITANISQCEQALSALDRHDPLRPIGTFLLAYWLGKRYKLLNQKDDIDEAILHLTESLLSFKLSSPLSALEHGPLIIYALFSLAISFYERSRGSMEPEDAIYAAKYCRYLRNPAHIPFAFQRQKVTMLLVETLALQMELKASDIVQTFEEMTALTQELLTSDPSSDYTAYASACLARAVGLNLPEPSPEHLLNEIIECLRLAWMHKPELREVPVFLAKCLYARYRYTMSDDLEEVASIVDDLIATSSPGDEFLAEYQAFVPGLAMIRLMVDRPTESSEDAIYRARAFLTSSASAKDPLHPAWSQVLEHAAENRFRNFGPIDDPGASSSGDPLSPPPIIKDGLFETNERMRPLSGILDGIRNNSITDIEEAIDLARSIKASSDLGDLLSMISMLEFCDILYEAFVRTKNISYLNESVDSARQLLARRPPKFLRISIVPLLLGFLDTRSDISPGHLIQDYREMVELLPQFLNDESQSLSLPYQFHFTCTWARLAQCIQHPYTSKAYETALSLMQDFATFSPTVQLQHATLIRLPASSHQVPLDYASYQVEQGQLEKAIQTLERGRSLIWSGMRYFRISIDQLLDAHPELGHKFAALNRNLEEITKSVSPSPKICPDDVVVDDLRAGDQFGSLLLRQRGLLKERDQVISQIRALPGFDRFLTFPLFDALRSVASSGPVIIVNHSILRSDILILLHNTSPSIIPTPDDFFYRASALKDKILISRVKDGLDSSQYDDALSSVLTELYELVGKPVIARLRRLHVPEQSRIWWCPTSVFCSLPLHAMGPIPSDDGELRYFLDLYICSYTPSLSALIQSRSRNSGSRSSNRPSVLLVAQTDKSLPKVGGEIQVVQALDTEITSLISDEATPAAVLNGFHHHQFVHFACHGSLEANKPFEAGFELHGDERLTLLDIVRADLPTAEFAFLSACHTAEVTEGSIMDEGLHLAAAVQYSGFRSVVGTMWAMVDEDGRDLAENFYKALFSSSRRDQGIPYHERSAKALRFAVKKLRRKRRITLERWVNFVHYGA